MEAVDNGWARSADAWIADMGDHGDFGRRYVLDPVMVARALAAAPARALDVGCGEGRFRRMLGSAGTAVTGLDPTLALIAAARDRDPSGCYLRGRAERLPFRDRAFDLIVSYLTLIDISDIDAAIPEMARVLAPGGTLLIANLTSFTTPCADRGWVTDERGERLHYPIDNYLDDRGMWVEWRGIRILNFHRPMRRYMKVLLDAGLQLTWLDEPEPIAAAPEARASEYRRVPWFVVMEWRKPDAVTESSQRSGRGGGSVTGCGDARYQ
jgi:SAM-dependent methyltransferase